MTQDELLDYLHRGLGICGCSDNDQVVRFLVDLLEAGEMRSAGKNDEANALLDEMLPAGDCLERNLPVYWLTAGGLVEHGATLDTYTLSEVGEIVLEALREYANDDGLWVIPEGTTGRVWN